MKAPASTRAQFDSCDNCQAPLDDRQRYCVVCGTRRPGADDPAARYFATASRRARAGSAPRKAPARSSSNLRIAVVLALVPVAAAIGVQVGRGNNDDKLLDALKSQKTPVVRVVGGGGAATANASDTTLSSDFTLDKGFTVLLKTLPVSGTTQSDVDAAVKSFEGKGLKDVALVSPKDFSVKGGAAGVYSIVSGAFKTRAEAEQALKAIKKKAPGAKVIEVSRKAGGSSNGHKVLSRTKYGSARQLTGAKTTKQDLDASKQALDRIVHSKGKQYVEQQRNLPDTIVIP